MGKRSYKALWHASISFALLVAILPFNDAVRDLLGSKGYSLGFSPLCKKILSFRLASSLPIKTSLRYRHFGFYFIDDTLSKYSVYSSVNEVIVTSSA